MIRLKHILPDPCKTIQNLDSVMRTNISELRQKIERAKLITSTLQVLIFVYEHSIQDTRYKKLYFHKQITLATRATRATRAILINKSIKNNKCKTAVK